MSESELDRVPYSSSQGARGAGDDLVAVVGRQALCLTNRTPRCRSRPVVGMTVGGAVPSGGGGGSSGGVGLSGVAT